MRSRFGSIKKLGEQSYHVHWSADGKRHSKRIHGTLKDAQAFLAMQQLGQNTAVPSITFSQYWDMYVTPTFVGLSERTKYDYTTIWEKHLKPRIGRTKVSGFTWRDAQNVLDRIDSPSAQSYCYRILKKVCNLAIRDGILQTNPIDRNIRLKQTKKASDVYTIEDVKDVLSGAKGYKHEYMVALELGGGLRHEEACAITRGDISIEEGYVILSVSKALTSVGGVKVCKNTKTEFSERLVALGEPFRSVIIDNMDKIPSDVIEQSNPVSITRNWGLWCKKRNVKHQPFGRMRSSFATIACECCDSSLVSMVMGHSDGTTRGKHYQKLTLAAAKIVADCYSDYVGRC